jgi:hypothetical protein
MAWKGLRKLATFYFTGHGKTRPLFNQDEPGYAGLSFFGDKILPYDKLFDLIITELGEVQSETNNTATGWEIRICLDVCYSGNAVSYAESLEEEDFD